MILAVVLLVGIPVYTHYVEQLVVPTNEYFEHAGAVFGVNRGDRRFLPPDEQPTFSLPSAECPRIDGATSLSPLYTVMASYVFSKEWPESRVPGTLSVNTTPVAYNRLIAGEADIIFVFPPSEEQEARARDAGRALTVTPIGREAFVFFVNEENPTDGLSVQQLRDIYAGRVRRWSEVGGTDARIVPFQRAKNSGSQSRMERFMEGDRLEEPRTEWRVASMGGIVEKVARYRNYRDALGFSFLYYIENMVDARGLKLLAIDGVAPTTDSIRDGTYPLTDTLCAVTAGEPSSTTTAFIEWILSPQGQRMVELGGYTAIRNAD